MFPMTMTIHNQEQFDLVANALRAKIATVTDKPKADTAKKSDGAQSTGGTSESTASDAQSGTGTSPTGLEYEKDVKPAVLNLVSKKGADAARTVLNEYNVTKADQVSPQLWASLVDKLNKAAAA